MIDLQPLLALLAQTERERDAALADHRQRRDALHAAEAQQQQLVAYRRDYEQRWQRQFAHGGRAELLQCYQAFVERLNRAVDGQARTARQAAAEAERAAATLRDHELRCASVRKLIERRELERRVDLERRDQRTADELAARSVWTRLAADRAAVD